MAEKKSPQLEIEWLLTLVVLLGMLYAGTANYLEQNQLKKEGRIAKGTVTDNDADDKLFHVEYLFHVGADKVKGAAAITYNLNPGDSIAILYLPSDPHINQPVRP